MGLCGPSIPHIVRSDSIEVSSFHTQSRENQSRQ